MASKEYHKEWRKNNPEKTKESARKWRDANPKKYKEMVRKSRERKLKIRSSQGLCHYCPTQKMPNSNSSCEKHWFMLAAKNMFHGVKGAKHPAGSIARLSNLLKGKLIAQNYTCSLSGRKLEPGKNAVLGHTIPKSKRPDLAGDINNVTWLDNTINLMQTDMTRQEFLLFCEKVVQHTGSKYGIHEEA